MTAQARTALQTPSPDGRKKSRLAGCAGYGYSTSTKKETVMKKTATNRNSNGAKAGGLAFRHETIRTLTPAESTRVLGGMRCSDDRSCLGDSCPNSVCTITLDRTI
jgi:hypothetical protein